MNAIDLKNGTAIDQMNRQRLTEVYFTNIPISYTNEIGGTGVSKCFLMINYSFGLYMALQ